MATPAELRQQCADALSSLDRATRVQSALGLKIHSVGFLWSRVGAFEGNSFPSRYGNSCAPFAVPPTIFLGGFANTHQAILAIRTRSRFVLAVLGRCDLPQVRPSVVSLDAVDMVNLAFRPRTSHVKPNEPMCHDLLSGDDAKLHVSLRVKGAYLGAPARIYTRQNTCRRIVGEFFTRLFGAKVGVSHEAVLSLIGQRFAQCFQHSRTSPFYRSCAA